MKIALDAAGDRNVVLAYGPGEVRVNETVYTASLLLTPQRIVANWPPQRFADLAAVHFEMLVELAPEMVILGTGAQLRFPAAACLAPLVRAQIGVEVMDTGAACRTYNILMAEGRRVLAALLMIERGRQKSESTE